MENSIKTLEQFRATKREMSIADYCKEFGVGKDQFCEDCVSLLVYCNGLQIQQFKHGVYFVEYMRDSASNIDLSIVEEVFWDEFVKEEIGVTSDEALEDLNERTRIFIAAQGFPANSLDELQYEDLFGTPFMNEAQKAKTRYFLKQFVNH